MLQTDTQIDILLLLYKYDLFRNGLKHYHSITTSAPTNSSAGKRFKISSFFHPGTQKNLVFYQGCIFCTRFFFPLLQNFFPQLFCFRHGGEKNEKDLKNSIFYSLYPPYHTFFYIFFHEKWRKCFQFS